MSIEVVDAAESQRYEARRDGTTLGFAAYQRTAELTVFTHTEIDSAYEGQGVGGTLVKGALEDVRERNHKVIAVCPFVEGWMRRHPEYADLDYRAPKSSATD